MTSPSKPEELVDEAKTKRLHELLPVDDFSMVGDAGNFCVVLHPGDDGFRLTFARLKEVAELVGHESFEVCISPPGTASTLQSYAEDEPARESIRRLGR